MRRRDFITVLGGVAAPRGCARAGAQLPRWWLISEST